MPVDLYPRDGKYNHAADVWELPQRGSTSENRSPQAALVVNFDRKGLTLRELETLLHEFGHSLHEQPSATMRYASDGGTNVDAGLRRGAVADARGLGLRQEGAQAVPGGLPDLQAGARRTGRQGQGREGLRQGHQIARQRTCTRAYDLALHGTRPRPTRWTPGRRWTARRRSATCPARCSRPASITSPADTAPGTTGTSGASSSRWTCAPPSRPTSSTPRSARAIARTSSGRAGSGCRSSSCTTSSGAT